MKKRRASSRWLEEFRLRELVSNAIGHRRAKAEASAKNKPRDEYVPDEIPPARSFPVMDVEGER